MKAVSRFVLTQKGVGLFTIIKDGEDISDQVRAFKVECEAADVARVTIVYLSTDVTVTTEADAVSGTGIPHATAASRPKG